MASAFFRSINHEVSNIRSNLPLFWSPFEITWIKLTFHWLHRWNFAVILLFRFDGYVFDPFPRCSVWRLVSWLESRRCYFGINIRVLAVGQRTACWAFRSLEKFHSTIHCFRDSEDSARVGWIDDIYIIQRRPTCVISRFTSLLPRLSLAVRGIDVSSLRRIIFYNTATSHNVAQCKR